MTTGRVAAVGVIFALAMPWIALRAQGTMMQSCEHHQAMTAAMTSIEKLVADNKTSKDIAALHDALNQIGSQVAKMQDGEKKCSAMMEMMEKMKAMPQKGADEHQHP